MNRDQEEKAKLYNKGELLSGAFSGRHIVRLVESWQEQHGLTADGHAGPMTQSSINSDIVKSWASTLAVSGLDAESQFVDGKWLPWDGPAKKQPRTYKESKIIFGDPETSPGSDVLHRGWYHGNIVEFQGSNAMPGVPAKWYFKIHRIVAPYVFEGLRRAQLSVPDYHIKRFGGFVFRHIRYDSSRPLSAHAMGCAFDVDPPQNHGIMFKRGKAPTAWSPEYYKFWPNGVSAAWVQALTSCGFAWGSDWDEDGETADHRWLDPMHFEWIARDGNQFDV